MARELNFENFDEKNLKASCAFHSPDLTPSMIYNPKNYTFHCFSCGTTVDIIDVFIRNGLTYIESVQKLFKEAKIEYTFGEVGVKTKQQYKYPKSIPLNDKSKVCDYLGKRGISKETINYADIREDEHGNIAFNYYDTNDVLTMVKYRPSHKIDKASGELKAWCQHGSSTTPLLFNINRINMNEPLLIQEGEIDSLAVMEAGYKNVVSVPFGAGNFSWIEENYEWLEQFDSIIICADNDEAGMKMQKECVYRLGSWRTKFIDIPHFHIDENGRKFEMKDMNHVLYYKGKQAVLDLIHNAKDPGVPSVQDLSDIEETDLDEIDGVQTGILGLDAELMKLFNGTVTVLTGQPGAGKTSFISQLVCQAIDNDKNTWIYSKEMPAWMTKSWLNYLLAGRHNLMEYRNQQNGSIYYKVSKEAKDKINKAYKNKWFIYRDDASNKLDDILKSMHDSVRKHGTKLLILDNLMMLDLGVDENNEHLKQTEVMNKLIDFAMKFSVAVVLVAHPRKLKSGEEAGIYDVSGTANIVNLAHRAINLTRLKGAESGFDVRITILKDRMRGKSGSALGMYYDVPSRRFYTNESEFNYQYSWDTEIRKLLTYPHADEREIIGDIKVENVPKLS